MSHIRKHSTEYAFILFAIHLISVIPPYAYSVGDFSKDISLSFPLDFSSLSRTGELNA